MKSLYMEALCSKKRMRIFLVLLLLLALFTVGCASEKPEAEATPDSRLKLILEASDEPFYTHISADELGAAYDNEILYHFISKVSIQIDGEYVDLVEAIRDGMVTPEEIVAYAKIDARNGQCEMQYQSEVGYAHYSYIYEEFELVTSYDIFEAPDGLAYHIESLTLGLPGYTESASFGHPTLMVDGEWQDLGRENWGIEFVPGEASSSGLTLQYTQSGGQHIGALHVFDYSLWDIVENDWNLRETRQDNFSHAFESILLLQDGSFEMFLDWSDRYDDLPPGEYGLIIWVRDVFNGQHEFMKDYTYEQMYTVVFKVLESSSPIN